MPDGVLADEANRLVFALHPVPTSADVVAIHDPIMHRLTDESRDDSVDEGVDPFLADVAATAEAKGCDTVVYALCRTTCARWSRSMRRASSAR